MGDLDNSFTSVSYQEQLERAMWYKNDLEKGGWREIQNTSDGGFWIKTMPSEEVPIKILFTYNMPMSAAMFMKMLNADHHELRKKWDSAFANTEILERYPNNGGYVLFLITKTPWPLRDRNFVLFTTPHKEVEWFGEKAFLIVQKNAWHRLKPTGDDGMIRATNGGNFFIVIPDEKNPESSCRVFSLSNNNYNGCLPQTNIEFVLARLVPKVIGRLQKDMIAGYEKYFKDGQN